jgi:predicted kinase
MPRLIHLNGPSRVGKSTLAHRYADEHPRTLVLDLDVLAGLIGGWRDNLAGALEVARGLGRELAARHLRDAVHSRHLFADLLLGHGPGA